MSAVDKRAYLQSLDAYINAGRADGALVLGWSKIDHTLPKAPAKGFVGVFGLRSAEHVHAFEKVVGAAEWYESCDSTNISIDLLGATEPEPHKMYARLLNVSLG